MWTIIKLDKKYKKILKIELNLRLGGHTKIYSPKLHVEKYFKNKLVMKEFDLLGDYMFCYNPKFQNPNILKSLKFTKGLKYFLSGHQGSQKEIKSFIEKCKQFENSNGYLTQGFFKLCKQANYKFNSGPFVEKIFRIIDLQKNKIDILLGNIKTTINKKKFLFSPV